MNRFFGFIVIIVMMTSIVQARPLMKDEKVDPKIKESLRDQMDKMIMSVFDMDVMLHKNQELDYEILEEDAQRILEAIQKIKVLDENKVFVDDVKKLEEPTRKLLHYSKKKSVKARKYPQEIFDACFKCHTQHRDQPLFSPQTENK